MNEITIRTPDDWHVHLRDGDMLGETVPATARCFRRAIVMPNLVPPVVTGYLLYERLTQTLMHGIDPVAGGETALVDSLAELRQSHPWLLLRLVRELLDAHGQIET